MALKDCGSALLACAALLALTACSMTLGVKGQLADGSETFTGTATGGSSGSGTLELVSNKGRRCTGDFVYITKREGSGTFQCSDGQSGPFEFVSTGTEGTGTGTIGGKPFTFTFG